MVFLLVTEETLIILLKKTIKFIKKPESYYSTALFDERFEIAGDGNPYISFLTIDDDEVVDDEIKEELKQSEEKDQKKKKLIKKTKAFFHPNNSPKKRIPIICTNIHKTIQIDKSGFTSSFSNVLEMSPSEKYEIDYAKRSMTFENFLERGQKEFEKDAEKYFEGNKDKGKGKGKLNFKKEDNKFKTWREKFVRQMALLSFTQNAKSFLYIEGRLGTLSDVGAKIKLIFNDLYSPQQLIFNKKNNEKDKEKNFPQYVKKGFNFINLDNKNYYVIPQTQIFPAKDINDLEGVFLYNMNKPAVNKEQIQQQDHLISF